MTGTKIETDNRPHQPPKGFRHKGKPLHTFCKLFRVLHSRDKEPDRPQSKRRTRQPVQPVNDPVKDATLRARKLGGKLRKAVGPCRRIPHRPVFCIFAKDLRRLNDHIAVIAKKK